MCDNSEIRVSIIKKNTLPSFKESILGKEILDRMLNGTETIDEIVEFFRHYSIEGTGGFEPRFYRSNRLETILLINVGELKKLISTRN